MTDRLYQRDATLRECDARVTALRPGGELRVRFPSELHARLAALAEQEGVSLNSYIVYLLTRASTAAGLTGRASHPHPTSKRKRAGQRGLARTG